MAVIIEKQSVEDSIVSDYEFCGYCGYDHKYHPEEAYVWHTVARLLGLSAARMAELSNR